MLIHGAKLILGGGVALVGGFTVPSQGFGVFECQGATAKIVIPERELRLSVASRGGPAKSVEVSVRERCRRLG
jgi:hypothetical protein